MSRAMRRQSLVQKPPAKTPGFRPSGARPAPKQQSAVAVETARKKHFYDPIVRYFRDIVVELKKVTWPTREETLRLTIAVIAVSVVIGMALGGVDIFFNWLVDHTLLRQ